MSVSDSAHKLLPVLGITGRTPPLELAEDLIEALSIPMDTSLLCQVSNSIENKARTAGISFAAARDQILAAARAHPPPDGKWRRWFQDAVYGHP